MKAHYHGEVTPTDPSYITAIGTVDAASFDYHGEPVYGDVVTDEHGTDWRVLVATDNRVTVVSAETMRTMNDTSHARMTGDTSVQFRVYA